MKKGFTLIEILATIVILGIIMLIAIPQVMNSIGSAKQASFLRSSENIAHAAELKFANHETMSLTTPYTITYTDGVLVGSNDIKIKGQKPDFGLITINSSGQVKMALWDNNLSKCVVKQYTDEQPAFDDAQTDKDSCLALVGGVMTIAYSQVTDTNPGIICGSALTEDYAGNTTCNIKSIEDLVAFSNLAKTQTFTGKTVSFDVNLDFQSNKSYVDPNTTVFGDVNGNTTTEGLKIELTTAKGFYPIGSLAVKFNGTFVGNAKYLKNLYISRSTVDYNGLFGYTNTAAVIKGISVIGATVAGRAFTGILCGMSDGAVNNVIAKGNVSGTNYIALAIGYTTGVNSGFIVEGNVTGSAAANAGVIGYANGGSINGAINKGGALTGTVNITRVANNISISNAGASKLVTINGSTTTSGSLNSNDGLDLVTANINDISSYDSVGLDTVIGGDNNSDGYYFDYNVEGEIAVTIASAPVITMAGAGTAGDPYQITTHAQLNEISLNKTAYYKLMNDIDLSSERNFMLSTINNQFGGTFDGNNKKLSNINIVGITNTGLFGYLTGTIKGLYIDNITTSGLSNTGALVGYGTAASNIKGITITNANVVGTTSAGIIVGTTYGTVSSAVIRGNISGANYIALAVGYAYGNVNDIIVSGNVTGTAAANAGVVGYSNGLTLTGAVNEGGALTGTTNITRIANNMSIIGASASKVITVNGATKTSSVLTSNDGMDLDAINLDNLNSYETTGLDTVIGGDNNSDGYYFDYDSNGHVALANATMTNTMAGAGTIGDPYQITSADHLKQVLLNKTAYYKLMNNIDLSGLPTYMLSSNVNRFAGNFDGNGMKLSNLNIIGREFTALFGYLTGTVDDLTIENITVYGLSYTGGIAGYNTAASTVKGVNVTGASVSGTLNVGVLVGHMNGTVSNCYAGGNVVGTNYVGVAMGYSTGTITKVMVNGNISGTINGAGVLGYANGGSIATSANLGGTLNGTSNVTRIGNNVTITNSIALNTILVKGSTVTSMYNWTNDGLDTTAANLLVQGTYTGIGFNFTDTTVGTYIWKMSGSTIWVEKN